MAKSSKLVATLMAFFFASVATNVTQSAELLKKSTCELQEFCAPEFWVVNSRCAPRCNNLDVGFESLIFQRWCPSSQSFVRESRESFLAAQACIPTLMFTHGNSLDHEGALESGWKMYNRVKVCPGKKLLVLWSWPAEILYKRPLRRPIELARKNIKAKYVYAEHQGYYVAKLTSMMSTTHPLTLSGHSFGAVVSLSAAHYLGGGYLNGKLLPEGYEAERPNIRASLISPALDNDHLYPGHRYGNAIVALEKLHTTFSTKDATLKRWPTHSFRGQQALGYTGICISRLGEHAHKVCQQRLTEDVGRSHYMREHLASVQMISAVCQTAFNNLPVGGSSKGSMLSIPEIDIERVIQAPAQLVFPGLAL